MSYQNWDFEYQKILTNYKMLSAKGFKELVINAINVLLSNKVNDGIDMTSKIQNLINIKSNLEDSLVNDMETSLRGKIF